MLISSCIGRQVIHLVISPTAIYMTAMQLIHNTLQAIHRLFTDDYKQYITRGKYVTQKKNVQHYMLGSIQR